MPTVLITDYDFPDLSLERKLLTDADLTLITTQATTEAEVADTIRSADSPIDAILTQWAPIGDQVFEAATDLKVVGRYGIGVDNVDVESATSRDIPVVNVPTYCVDEVATHTIALLLSCVRKVPTYDRSVRAGDWDWEVGHPIERLQGKTLGLAGFGNIPNKIARMLSGFDLDIIVYDPYQSKADLDAHNVEKVNFNDLLARADIVSIHTPLTDETRSMFDADAFSKLQDSAFLINTSRGGVVDTTALADAIAADEIAGAGLDVFPDEPLRDSPLREIDEVVLTPHVAWYSEQSIEELRRTLTQDIIDVLHGAPPRNPVNDDATTS